MASRLVKHEYFPISPLILRANTRSPFNVFLRNEDNYVLFNAKGGVLTDEKRQELNENRVTRIYIDKRDLDAFRVYLVDKIGEVLDDESIPIEDRAKAWSNTAVALSKELFEEKLPGPAFEKRYQRFESLVQSTAGFLQSPKSLKHLSRFISKGYDLYHHGVSTMVYTVCLMQEFEYDDYKTLACGMGALLHDIGKEGLPDGLCDQDPSTLCDNNRDILALHPMIGVRVCASFNLPPVATNCILFHHERADGKGFPSQATSDELPLHAKVVALCNVYDNLTRNMPWRKALRPYDALKKIMEDEGLVDRNIIKKFIEMLSRAELV